MSGPDLALAGRVDAIVDALLGDEVGDDERLGGLARLLAQARGDATELDFAVDGGERPLDRLRREWSEFADRALRELDGRAWIGGDRLRTRVGWTGELQIVAVGDTSAEERAGHALAVRAVLDRAAQRVHLLTTIAVAARRIAGLIAAPVSLVSALPVAFACVREAHGRGGGGALPWQ